MAYEGETREKQWIVWGALEEGKRWPQNSHKVVTGKSQNNLGRGEIERSFADSNGKWSQGPQK